MLKDRNFTNVLVEKIATFKIFIVQIVQILFDINITITFIVFVFLLICFFFNNFKADLLGNGIFVVDGDLWKQHRKAASHLFATKKLRQFQEVLFLKYVFC